MKVLVVTFGSILEPRGGLAVRTRTDVDMLTAMGHELTVLSHFEPSNGALAAISGASVIALRRRLYLGWSNELRSLCRELVPHSDFTVVSSALLLPAVLSASTDTPVVWDTNECETLHYARLPRTPRNLVKRFIWRRLETWAARRANVVLAIGETEADWWRKLFPSVEGKVMIVDHRPFLSPVIADSPIEVSQDRRILLFVGNLVGKHNSAAARWLVEEVAPRLVPKDLLVLAGPGTERLRVPDDLTARVRCLGDVTDLDALISTADLCLAPLAAGAGIKTKVLHYLALGKPVLATPSAAEGIEDAPGIRIVALNEFHEAIAEMLEHDDSHPEIGEQSIWFEQRCGDAALSKQWGEVIERLSPSSRVPSLPRSEQADRLPD